MKFYILTFFPSLPTSISWPHSFLPLHFQYEVIHKMCLHLIARDYSVEVCNESFIYHGKSVQVAPYSTYV